jgi:peptidoglycan-N-acetylglucosamine deacetylase
MIKNPVPWPDGARCAVAFTFDLDADSILHLAHHTTADTRVAAMSMLRYGPEIAMPRLVDMYARFDMHQTFFLPAWCMERYPKSVEVVLEGGHEVAHHGYLHEHPNELSREEELGWLQRSTDVIVKMTGQRPRGFRAPTYKFSRNTLDHLVAEGFDYDASLMGDDVPYVLENDAGRVLELPSHYALDDWPHFMVSRDFNYIMSMKTPKHAMELYAAEFDAMWECGGLWIAVWHPFLSGRLARALEIARLIEYMHEKGKVWFARLDEITDHVNKIIADGAWSPRVDRLPYYDGPIPELGEASPEPVRP